MNERRERVILDVSGNFVGEMTKAAAAAQLLNQQLGILDRSGRMPGLQQTTQRDLPALGLQLRRTGNDIDRFSGRLGLMAQGFAAIGPSLTPITTSLVPGLAALTTGLGFTVVGAGSVVVAFQGVGDALGAVNKAALEPTVENIAAAEEALNRLAPAAQAAVLRMRDLGPALKEIRDAAAGGFFPGFIAGLDSFEQMAPRVASFFETIGDVTGDLFAAGAADLGSGRWSNIADYIESEARPAMMAWGGAIGDVTHGLGELWVALDPLTDFGTRGFAEMAASFDEWAMNLSQTDGYAEFIAYVEETGPQVLETLGSLADAFLQIAEAAAPLGGPILQFIEVFADAIAKIADSPLGAPIMAAVTAMSALSLATSGLNKVMASSFIAGGGSAGVGLRAGLSNFRTDLALATTAIAMDTKELERNRAARARVAGTLKRGAVGAGAVGVGLGLSAAGADLTFTAMGAAAGSVIPGIGTAAGAATGALIDMARSFDSAEDSARAFDRVFENGTLDEMSAALDEKRAELEEFNDSWQAGFQKAIGNYDKSKGAELEAQIAEGAKKYAAAQEEAYQATKRTELSVRKISQAQFDLGGAHDLRVALNALGEEAGRTEDRVEAVRTALRKLFDKKFALSAAQNDWTQGLKALGEQLKGAALLGDSTQALANQDVIRGQAEALVAFADAQFAVTGDAEQMRQTLIRGARQIIKTGEDAGIAREDVRAYLKTLSLTPPEIRTLVRLNANQAFGTFDSLWAWMNRLDGRTATMAVKVLDYATNGVPQGSLKPGDSATYQGTTPKKADGGTVPKTGLPYADRHLYLLADGEEVISNRHGQADRHRALLKDINAGRLADGGTVSRHQAAAYASRSRDFGRHSGEQRLNITVQVAGEMDLERATAQIRGIAHEISMDNDYEHDRWKARQAQ